MGTLSATGRPQTMTFLRRMTREGLEPLYMLPLGSLIEWRPGEIEIRIKNRTSKPFRNNAEGLYWRIGSPDRTLLELPLRP